MVQLRKPFLDFSYCLAAVRPYRRCLSSLVCLRGRMGCSAVYGYSDHELEHFDGNVVVFANDILRLFSQLGFRIVVEMHRASSTSYYEAGLNYKRSMYNHKSFSVIGGYR